MLYRLIHLIVTNSKNEILVIKDGESDEIIDKLQIRYFDNNGYSWKDNLQEIAIVISAWSRP